MTLTKELEPPEHIWQKDAEYWDTQQRKMTVVGRVVTGADWQVEIIHEQGEQK